ncbi:hypothetical protein L9F63_010438, partial [Diploptera punctata]
LALSSAESPFSQTIKSKKEKRIFVPSTDRIRNLNLLQNGYARLSNLFTKIVKITIQNY